MTMGDSQPVTNGNENFPAKRLHHLLGLFSVMMCLFSI